MRKLDIDTIVMRIMASVAVVMTHVIDLGSNASIVMCLLTRFCVPVFIIVSGYYMLMKRKSVLEIVKKCVKLLLIMIVWSGIYYIYELSCGKQSFIGIRELLIYLFTEPGHFYYLYVACALYIFTPILYVFCENASQKEYLYALGLTFFLGSIITILLRTESFAVLQIIVDKMKVPYTQGFIFLYMLGGYLQRYPITSKQNRKIIYLFGILASLFAFVWICGSQENGVINDLLFSFFAPNAMLLALAVFVFIKQFYSDYPIKSNKTYRVLCEIGQCTYGIYLIHQIIIMILERQITMYAEVTSSYVSIISKTCTCFIVSLVIAFIMKKIPGIKCLVS